MDTIWVVHFLISFLSLAFLYKIVIVDKNKHIIWIAFLALIVVSFIPLVNIIFAAVMLAYILSQSTLWAKIDNFLNSYVNN